MKNEKESLQLAISVLKEKRALELDLLKAELQQATENFKIINIIKSTFDEIAESAEIKTAIFENVVGVGTGLLAKRIINDNTESVSRNYLAQIIQFVVAGLIINNKEIIKLKLERLLYAILKSRDNQ